MEIWLDSSDLNDATYCDAIGLINGITTNPKILANSQGSPLTTLQKLLAVNKQPICVQVTATHTDAIIAQARHLRAMSHRFIIKIQANECGFKAMKELVNENIPVLSTAIFTAAQVITSCKLNVNYIAPYLNHIKQSNQGWQKETQRMADIVDSFNCKSKLMMASIKSIDDIYYSMDIGAQAVTAPSDVLKAFSEEPAQTSDALKKFKNSWATVEDDLFNGSACTL
ncbi:MULTISPECIES: transaldolase family protein [Cysteiniphilum]|uniref:Putative transaldolase n=1 Tax=Cysteiniphilum litorale TaxID=2056700 RepID=A0A8J2Z579_9GAMM|nr:MULTISPECIES: transaldolase family protein [Cysteiniphilum]GGG00566.1 putative transaldolase [Cysteiniphilum litorale]